LPFGHRSWACRTFCAKSNKLFSLSIHLWTRINEQKKLAESGHRSGLVCKRNGLAASHHNPAFGSSSSRSKPERFFEYVVLAPSSLLARIHHLRHALLVACHVSTTVDESTVLFLRRIWSFYNNHYWLQAGGPALPKRRKSKSAPTHIARHRGQQKFQIITKLGENERTPRAYEGSKGSLFVS